jgi:hypothetical protein
MYQQQINHYLNWIITLSEKKHKILYRECHEIIIYNNSSKDRLFVLCKISKMYIFQVSTIYTQKNCHVFEWISTGTKYVALHKLHFFSFVLIKLRCKFNLNDFVKVWSAGFFSKCMKLYEKKTPTNMLMYVLRSNINNKWFFLSF